MSEYQTQLGQHLEPVRFIGFPSKDISQSHVPAFYDKTEIQIKSFASIFYLQEWFVGRVRYLER